MARLKLHGQLAHDLANELEEPLLHNHVYDVIYDDGQLQSFCAAASEAESALDVREGFEGRDAALVDELMTAWDRLGQVAKSRAYEVVAEACVEVIQNGDEWAENGPYDMTAVADAKHEAREWLQLHLDVAERVGALEVLD